MIEWRQCVIDDVFEVARGGSPRPIDKFITDDPEGINWIMIGDTTEKSKYITRTKKKILPSGRKKSRMVYPGDFLLTNSMSFGRPYINQIEGCIHDGWLVLSPRDKSAVHPDFFYYLLGSPEFKQVFAKQAAGAVVKNLNSEIVRAIPIRLPFEIEEQRRIARILDRADSIRAKRENVVSLANELVRSYFFELFGDLQRNTMNWLKVPLGEHVVHSNNGLGRRRKTEENIGDIVLRLQDVRENFIDYTGCNRIELDASEKSRFVLQPDDLLFVRVNGNRDYVGRCAVYRGYKEPVYHNDHLIRLRLGAAFDPCYLSFLFNLDVGRSILASSIKTSAGQHTISQEGLKAIEFPAPPIELQKQFRSFFEKLLRAKVRLGQAAREASNMFSAISQSAFRGEL